MSRPIKDSQRCLTFLPSQLKLTNDFYGKYEAISTALDACPSILRRVHNDLEDALDQVNADEERQRGFRYTSENVLRILLVQIIEGLSLREVVVRIDDSRYFPVFTRLGNRPVMSFGHLDRLKNAIQPETWRSVNLDLARYALRNELISGEDLRLDTTAIESNIHFPTDSHQLWDCYRVIGRLIKEVREWDPSVVGARRLRLRDVKRQYGRISRKAAKKGQSSKTLKPLYEPLIKNVEQIHEWGEEIVQTLTSRLKAGKCKGVPEYIEVLVESFLHYLLLTQRVISQTKRRVLDEESVPSNEKVYSIFEEHTELLKRGKAGKNLEFGHMVGIQQVRSKFITDFEVFETKPVEYELIEPALQSHRKLFGSFPDAITADKAYWKDKEALAKLTKKVPLVAICKKGNRTEEEEQREHEPSFKEQQKFRAGVEGSISFLKRSFRLLRCMNKGWAQFAATVGAAIVAHNLVTLARQLC